MAWLEVRRLATLGSAAAALVLAVAAFASSSGPAGSVDQVSGKHGCYTFDGSSEDGPDTCVDVRGSSGETSIALSPDDRFAYAVGYGSDDAVAAIQVYRRNRKTGALSQLHGKSGCISADGSSEDGPHTCTNGRDIDSGDGHSIAISADGRFLYSGSQLEVSGQNVGGITIFKRNLKSGKLTQLPGKKGCVSLHGMSEDGPQTCTAGREVDEGAGEQLSPDGKYLYSGDYAGPPDGGLAIFKRNARSGVLRQLKGKNGCITEDGTSPQLTGTPCRAGGNISDTWELAMIGNKFLYAASVNGKIVQGFTRNSAGGLVPLKGKSGCVSDTGADLEGTPDMCIDGRGLDDVERTVPSKDGRYIYAWSFKPFQFAVLDRNPKTGALSERSGKASCMTVDGSSADGPDTCRIARGAAGGYAGDLSNDGKTLYLADYTSGGLTVVHLSKATGGFHQLAGTSGCVTTDGSSLSGPNTCIDGRATAGAYEATLSHDGGDLYVPAYTSGGIAHFRVKR